MTSATERNSKLAEAIASARGIADEIRSSLPSSVPAAGLTLKSKLPFKALSVRELLIHRVSALATAAVGHLEQGNALPAIILTRAIVETTAVLFCLARAIEEFLETKDAQKLDKFLMQSIVGARWPDYPVQATNVLNLIDKVSKTIPEYRSSYDSLSEYAHPNWSGLLGIFGRIDQDKHELFLGFRDDSPAMLAGASVLAATLDVFKHYYNGMTQSFYEFDDHFDAVT
jgi:hypothetical protein